MAIAASKVKSVCTPAEAALVRASRKPELHQLSAARLKQHAARARKLAAKWQGLAREQARSQSRQSGFGASDPNTSLKGVIFRDALASFEAQLAIVVQVPAAKAVKRPTKKDRTAEHRARRAAIRKGMTAAEDLTNAPVPAAKPQPVARKNATPPAGRAPLKATAKPAAKAPPKRPAKGSLAATSPVQLPPAFPAAKLPKIAPAKARAKRSPSTTKAKQREATAAAMQSRLERSGKTTRRLGHLKARTQRTQGRRDSQ
jgi:hypothetical protein